jgi:hypothetical protein
MNDKKRKVQTTDTKPTDTAKNLSAEWGYPVEYCQRMLDVLFHYQPSDAVTVREITGYCLQYIYKVKDFSRRNDKILEALERIAASRKEVINQSADLHRLS